MPKCRLRRKTIKFYNNISQIVNNYDAFLIDLWGVIHDGSDPYPGVHNTLRKLQEAGKQVLFLSNAPRRVSMAVASLERMKIDKSLYNYALTSGEVTRDYIISGEHGYGKNYFIIGPVRDNNLLDGTEYKMVDEISKADFIVVTGFDNDDSTMDEAQPFLDEAIKYNLPLLCANPDFLVIRQAGNLVLCAGVIADAYAKMGGKVQQFGKPYGDVYKRALVMLGNPKSVAVIGDNLDTDILGGNDAGLDSYLIAGGVLSGRLGIKTGQMPDAKKLKEVCDEENITPTAVIPAFIWE